MKIMKLLFLLLFFPYVIFAEIKFSNQKIIDNTTSNPATIHSADFDDDGYKDVLVGCHGGDNILMWFKNNGNSTFSQAKIIEKSKAPVLCIFSADVNNDERYDIIAAKQWGGNIYPVIAWYENDGNGSFSQFQSIRQKGNSANSIYMSDIDDDGYQDIISVLGNPHEVTWHKNVNGKGTFSSPNVILGGLDFDNWPSIFPIDIDGDSDIDVISASSSGNKILWHNNTDGKGTFDSSHTVTTNVKYPTFVYGTDIDNDNDIDILSASVKDNKIAWYANMDGKGKFGSQKIITSIDNRAWCVYAADLDNDGDKDVISGCNNKITCYENTDGKGAFNSKKVITTSVENTKSVYAVDIDNDGDFDILSASPNDKKVAWYENLTNTTLVQDKQFKLPNNFYLQQNYPNPFNPSTTIKYNLDKSSDVILKINNLSGQELETLVDENQTAGEHEITWQPKGLPSGIYFYRFQASNPTATAGLGYTETRKLIFKK